MIKIWNDLKSVNQAEGDIVANVLDLLERLYKEIRKDLGHNDISLQNMELVSMQLDEDTRKKYINQ